MPQVGTEILFLTIAEERCILCRDDRKNYSVIFWSNFYMKANGLQIEKKKCG